MGVKKQGCILLISMLSCCLSAYAAPVSSITTNEQLDNMRRQAQEQQEQINAPWVQMQDTNQVKQIIKLPVEKNSFYIRRIEIDTGKRFRFEWLNELLEGYTDREIGLQGINMLAKLVSEELISAGYITAKVVVPEQDLNLGVLRFTLVPGIISDIRFENKDTWGTWRNAFPCRAGDILNVRALEQGLEQMKRLPNQDVNMQLLPGKQTGETEVVISIKRTKPWNIGLSVDNAGLSNTGKVQLSGNLSIYNPTGLNDMLTYRYGQNAEGVSSYNSSNYGLSYSIPYGYYTFSINKYHNDFEQTIPSIVPFKSSGKTDTLDFGFQRVIYRDQARKTQLSFKIIQKEIHNYINDTEIEVQKQVTTAYQIGIIHRQYFGKSVFDGMVYYQKGMPWLGAEAGLTDHMDNLPNSRYGLGGVYMNISSPIKLGKTDARYTMTMRAQVSMDTLYSTEQFAIGGRYTVRGFDGEQTLAAENGILIRNELGIPLKKANSEIYIGLDVGQVWGPSDKYLLGTKLAGSVLGIRGLLMNNLQYDAFMGTPLYKPAGFKTAKVTFGFSLYYSF